MRLYHKNSKFVASIIDSISILIYIHAMQEHTSNIFEVMCFCCYTKKLPRPKSSPTSTQQTMTQFSFDFYSGNQNNNNNDNNMRNYNKRRGSYKYHTLY